MFFPLSKIAWFVLKPLNFILLILFISLFLRRFQKTRIFAGRLLIGTALVFMVSGFLPVGYNMLSWLEQRYEVKEPDYKPYGIIVLGGASNLDLSYYSGRVNTNDTAERLLHLQILHDRYPNAKIIYAGGSGRLDQNFGTESDLLKTYLNQTKAGTNRVRFENKSRNTFENAEYTKELMTADELNQNWLLVTSAWHMRRAEAVFDKQNINVTPYPVDHLTRLDYRVFPYRVDVIASFWELRVAIKEFLGFFIYDLLDKV